MTRGQLMATSLASTPITEANIGGSLQAGGASGIEAFGVTVVRGAVATTYVVGSSVAIDDHGVQRGPFGEINGIPDESDVGVGSLDPVVDLVVGRLRGGIRGECH
ncbi:hypothetical protein AAF712_005234 [Marasmius tenuissimus]|uniref:Uncharacterized protein n=1 Tax=Marasmius tenuissimus TaxID=585030 RepID=A0ABR3A476_9AGAR